MATLLVNTGRAIVTGRMFGTPSQAEPKFLGIGSGAGTTAAADTTLFTEFVTGTWSGYARTSNTGTQATTSTTNDTVQWQGTFTAPAAEAVTNGGLFDAASVGNLYIKGDFATINLANGDTLTLTVKHQIQ